MMCLHTADKNEDVRKAAIGGLILVLKGLNPTAAVTHTCWAAEIQLSRVLLPQHWAPSQVEWAHPGTSEILSGAHVQQVLSLSVDDTMAAPDLLVGLTPRVDTILKGIHSAADVAMFLLFKGQLCGVPYRAMF